MTDHGEEPSAEARADQRAVRHISRFVKMRETMLEVAGQLEWYSMRDTPVGIDGARAMAARLREAAREEE